MRLPFSLLRQPTHEQKTIALDPITLTYIPDLDILQMYFMPKLKYLA